MNSSASLGCMALGKAVSALMLLHQLRTFYAVEGAEGGI